MQSGDLNVRVGFYRPQLVEAYAGNETRGFEPAPAVQAMANVKAKLGGEAVLAGRLTGRGFFNITVRQSASTLEITTDWKARAEQAGVDYAIRAIVDPESGTSRRGHWLELLCETGVAP